MLIINLQMQKEREQLNQDTTGLDNLVQTVMLDIHKIKTNQSLRFRCIYA